jgi:hypothetical protein
VSPDLQFQKAEFAGETRVCALCKTPLSGSFYTYAGHPICTGCAAQRSELKQADEVPSQAVLYGLGAAIAGTVVYAAVSMITGYQLSLISILVGYMVGRAIRTGAGGSGGLKLQILAVALTYLAVTTAPLLEVIFRLHAVIQITSIPRLIYIALISPFLELQASVGHGLLNVLIIFFGMSQAWRYTKGAPHTLQGPFQVGTAPMGAA